MLTEIIISGFGGQGALFAGKCLAYSAMMKDVEISWLPSYGPEMRGGTAKCAVGRSDEAIGSPLGPGPEILIAMSDPAVDKFINSVKSGGKVFVDSSLASTEITRKDIEVYRLPASQLAEEKKLGGMGNIVLLGKAIKECGKALFGIDGKTLLDTFAKIIPAKRAALIEKNAAALALGANS